jgi:hypothetical protein
MRRRCRKPLTFSRRSTESRHEGLGDDDGQSVDDSLFFPEDVEDSSNGVLDSLLDDHVEVDRGGVLAGGVGGFGKSDG